MLRNSFTAFFTSVLLVIASTAFTQSKKITVAKDGSGNYTTVQQAFDAIPAHNKKPLTIFIKKGTYKEKLHLDSTKDLITLVGEDKDATVLTYDDHTGKIAPSGSTINTYTSPSFFMYANDFTAQNITFENNAGFDAGQAVAASIYGDRAVFKNCRFVGFQDVLFTPSENSRQYYKNCYIEGSTDFIFGSATVLFEDCTIHSKKNSHVTAASTPKEHAYGYVFKNCTLTGDTSLHNVSLGRPWRPYASVTYIKCYIGAHILGEGWNNWKNTANEATARYAEYLSYGPGAKPNERVKWSKQLTKEEAAKYTIKNIFGNWTPDKAITTTNIMQPINTGLCSFGMSGKVFHAPFLDVVPGFNFYAVYERSTKEAANKYPGAISYDSLEQLLADENIELIVVNSPTYTHFDYAKKSLLAGKHVVVEKAFTTTVAEAQELIDLAKQQNKLIAVYQNRRFDSDFRTVKKVIDEKLLGDIVEAEFHFDRYKEELSPKAHKEVPGPGAGIVYDLGPHLIDQALYLFGMPTAVFADIAIQRPISQVDDYFEILLLYPNHRVRLKSGYIVREPLPSFIVHGTKGSFIKTRADVQEDTLVAGIIPSAKEYGIESETEKGLLHTEKNGVVIREHIATETGDYKEYYNQVYEAIRNNKNVPVSGQDGLNVIKIIELAYKSKEQKSIVEVV